MPFKVDFSEREFLVLYYESKKYNRPFNIFCAVIKALFVKYVICYSKESRNLFFLDSNREDYIELFNSYLDSTVKTKNQLKIMTNYFIDFYGFILFILNLHLISKFKLVCFPEEECKPILTKGQKIYIYARIIQAQKFSRTLKKDGLKKINNLFLLGDAWFYEQRLMIFCRDNKITCTTFQHALYNSNINNRTVDVLNYWRSYSYYQLVWGNTSKDLYAKYSPNSNVIVCGNPFLNLCNNVDLGRSIGIIFDQPFFMTQNTEMVNAVKNVASKLNFKITIRIHPVDNAKNYLFDKNCILDTNLDDCAYIVGHSSSMIFEYMIRGKKVFIFKSDQNKNKIPTGLLFQDENDLIQKIESKIDYNYNNFASQYIELIGELSRRELSDFGEKIRNKECQV